MTTTTVTTTQEQKTHNHRKIADPDWLGGAGEPDADQPQGARRAVRPTAAAARPAYKLTTRKPNIGQAWPLILITGGEFSGKSYQVAKLAATGRFGRVWWLPFGEDPDQYAVLVPDAEIVQHDGTLYEVAAAIDQIAAQVNAEPMVDGLPQLLVIDSGTPLWDLFTQIAERRACKSDEAQAALMRNPHATVTIGPLNWAHVNRLWQRITRTLKSMKAVVVMTARGKDGLAINARGKIDPDAPPVYRPAIQAETPYEATAYVRLDRVLPPQILGIRKAKGGLQPGVHEPLICDGKPRMRGGREITAPPFTLEWLLFDVLEFDAASAYSPQVIAPDVDEHGDQLPTTAQLSEQVAIVAGADEIPGRPLPAETLPAEGGGR